MFKIVKVFLTLFFALTWVRNSIAETPVRKCANNLPKPLAVQVNSCTETPCQLWRGFTNTMDIQFVSTRNNVRDIKADVNMTTEAPGMSLGLTPRRTNVCKNLLFEANCPIDAGQDVTYRLIMDIAHYQPEVPVKIEVSIKDASDDTVFACFILDAKIDTPHRPLII